MWSVNPFWAWEDRKYDNYKDCAACHELTEPDDIYYHWHGNKQVAVCRKCYGLDRILLDELIEKNRLPSLFV